MNFKPTIWKTIVSIFVGIIAFVWHVNTNYVVCNIVGCLPAYDWEGSVISFIVSVVIVYVIWSLIQKNSK